MVQTIVEQNAHFSNSLMTRFVVGQTKLYALEHIPEIKQQVIMQFKCKFRKQQSIKHFFWQRFKGAIKSAYLATNMDCNSNHSCFRQYQIWQKVFHNKISGIQAEQVCFQK